MNAVAADAELTARCHCGEVTIAIPRKPDRVAQCNCSICALTGWRGVYFASTELHIAGEFDSYVRSDIAEPMIELFRCKRCGIATHWEPLTEPPHERMGVNANLLPPAALEGTEVITVDGRSWS